MIGVGEGGLLALYAAAVDPRIDAALVSGYFQTARAGLGGADLPKCVELADRIRRRRNRQPDCPAAPGHRSVRGARSCWSACRRAMVAAAVRLQARFKLCPLAEVRTEFERAKKHYDKLGIGDRISLLPVAEGTGPSGSEPALASFLMSLGIDRVQSAAAATLELTEDQIDPAERQRRQVQELTELHPAADAAQPRMPATNSGRRPIASSVAKLGSIRPSSIAITSGKR